ncbi:MAG: general secretion pathway protein GspB [Candidatus Omnitrophota bacterium]
MYSPSSPQAIINGTMLKQGDTIDEFTIQKILQDKVIITSGSQKFELKVRY